MSHENIKATVLFPPHSPIKKKKIQKTNSKTKVAIKLLLALLLECVFLLLIPPSSP